MSDLKTYDASQVIIVVGPVIISEGHLADGTFVSAEKNEEAFSLVVGAAGRGTRAKTNNESGRATFTLHQSSAKNLELTTLHKADKLSGDGVVPLLIADRSGTTLVTAGTAWVANDPTVEFARESTDREWIVETDELIFVTGGN
jgi:hypothetical protein